MLQRLKAPIAQAAGEAASVEIAPASDPVWAAADPVQLASIILALVSASREDGKAPSQINVACRNEAIFEQLPEATLEAGLYACVTISDNGPGLDPEKRAAIFESILAAKDSAAPSLARAYATIRVWGGDIAVSSEPSQGTSYTIYLPQSEPLMPVAEPAVEPVAKRPSRRWRLRSRSLPSSFARPFCWSRTRPASEPWSARFYAGSDMMCSKPVAAKKP